VVAGHRSTTTRALPLDTHDQVREPNKKAQPGTDDDDDLDLFTDDRPSRR
jgi:hypothetical protein